MSKWGKGFGGHFYVFTLLHVPENSEHFFFCYSFGGGKINYFHGKFRQNDYFFNPSNNLPCKLDNLPVKIAGL